MQDMLMNLLSSLVANPDIQKLILAEIAKIPGFGGIVSEIISMFLKTTAPSSTPKTIQAGPSQTVKNLQTALNASGTSPSLTVDGYFGPKTEAALKAAAAKLGVHL